MKFTPHEYQERAIRFILDNPRAGLLLDMGLGKTVITLTAVEELMHDRYEIARVLVIAPLRVAEDTWSREAEKWDHLQGLTISKVLGSAAQRKAALSADADVYVINRENVVWLVDFLKLAKMPWPFDMIVIDELSSFKSPSAKRFRALRKVRAYADRIVGLTGTPAANSLMDLWAEMFLLDGGERLGSTITEYRRYYFRPGYAVGSVVYKWEPLKGSLRVITKKISDITVSMKAADYLQLPDRIDTTAGVILDEAAAGAYRQMERDSLLSLPGEDGEILAASAAAVMTKLLQMANGFVYDEEGEAHELHRAKLDALLELIEAAGSPVLVYYSFRADLARILQAVDGARLLQTDRDITDWNAGRIPVLLAHPASAGYGLNLQEGGHNIVWYGLPWSLEQYSQANARLIRQGQGHPVTVSHVIARGTVDEDVERSLARKDTTQNALLEILKARMYAQRREA